MNSGHLRCTTGRWPAPSVMVLMNMQGVVAWPNLATCTPLLVRPAASDAAKIGPLILGSLPICMACNAALYSCALGNAH